MSCRATIDAGGALRAFRFFAVLLSVLLFSGAAVAQLNLVTNGTFEGGFVPDGNCDLVEPDADQLPSSWSCVETFSSGIQEPSLITPVGRKRADPPGLERPERPAAGPVSSERGLDHRRAGPRCRREHLLLARPHDGRDAGPARGSRLAQPGRERPRRRSLRPERVRVPGDREDRLHARGRHDDLLAVRLVPVSDHAGEPHRSGVRQRIRQSQRRSEPAPFPADRDERLGPQHVRPAERAARGEDDPQDPRRRLRVVVPGGRGQRPDPLRGPLHAEPDAAVPRPLPPGTALPAR